MFSTWVRWRYRREDLPGGVGALAVQSDQEVLPGQLRGRHPDQQLSAGEPPIAGLDRPDRRIQSLDHAQPVDQLGHRRQPRHRGQRRVRRADPHPPPQPADLAYCAHLNGCPLDRDGCGLVTAIIPGQAGTYRHLRGRVAQLLADSGLTAPQHRQHTRGGASTTGRGEADDFVSRSSHVRQRAASWPSPGSFVVAVVTAGRASACGWQTLGVAALVTPCVGLLLAIAGVSCAGGAVFQTWREHEHRPLFPVLAATISRGRAAARRLKWWEPEREEVQGSLTLSAEFSLQAHGTVTGPNIPADAPVDEAVRLLERRVERIEENAREARQQHKTSVKELRTELASHGGCATGDRRRSASSHEGCRHQHREPAALGD